MHPSRPFTPLKSSPSFVFVSNVPKKAYTKINPVQSQVLFQTNKKKGLPIYLQRKMSLDGKYLVDDTLQHKVSFWCKRQQICLPKSAIVKSPTFREPRHSIHFGCLIVFQAKHSPPFIRATLSLPIPASILNNTIGDTFR